MARRKVHYIHVEKDFQTFSIDVDEFDTIVDGGYDDILIVTPRARFIASVDEWLDYGYIDLDGDAEVRSLSRAYMGRA